MGGIRLDDVQCCLELGEDEHLVTEREEAGEEAVEEQHFARRGDEGLVEVRGIGLVGGLPGPVEVVRAVAREARLHDGVLEFLVRDFLFGGLKVLGAGNFVLLVRGDGDGFSIINIAGVVFAVF